MADVCLLPFKDANLQVNGVSDDVRLDGVNAGEDVAVVVVEVPDGIVIDHQPVV